MYMTLMTFEEVILQAKNSTSKQQKQEHLNRLRRMRAYLEECEKNEIQQSIREIKNKSKERKDLLDEEIKKRESLLFIEKYYSVTLGKLKPETLEEF